jgi:hypothetical protein
MNPNTYPSEQHRIPERRLWYGFSAAPLAWGLQGIVGVIVSAEFCPAGLPSWEMLGQNGVRLLLGLITAGLLAVAISGGVVAFRNWQALAGPRSFFRAEAPSREVFMSVGGILISAAFTVGLLWSGIPLIMVEQCLRGE